MLNFWKTIQSKKNPTSSANINNTGLNISSDGLLPLKDFEYGESDLYALEKCRLSLNFGEALVLENSALLSMFRQFLDHRNSLSLYHLYMALLGRTDIEDELLRTNLLRNISVHRINFPDLLIAKINNHSKHIDIGDLKEVTDKVYAILQEYWNSFVQTDMFCKYQVDVLTGGQVTLGDILLCDGLLSYFMEFLDSEGCRSIVEFWLAATNFKSCVEQLKSTSVNYEQAQSDAICIYEKYLSLQATCSLGFTDQVRITVEESICPADIQGQTVTTISQCFRSAVLVVLAFLRHRCLMPFLSSQHYVRYLSELIKAGNSYQSLSQDNESSSSSVSEYSTNSKRSMSSLLPYSASTDSLWRKRQQSGLSFGRVDEYGRFERNIEPDPDKNKESGIRRMMKKFVNKEGVKMQEDMAWQVAEMIIKDVTSVTMANNDEDFGAE
ncbi:A-kinase anchor protein 10, mitochondrial [Rhopalosiphum maidis]|uniref:A-kinase anchor protein 10, mitochondrial n=1 Tax=Rhopalosiphum maidis TaxID=43146 RepID=UPI000EFE6DB1|nr:A-kinase anchor protein 10, mitochondrial [Rhopalosiphum maidis]XP_026804616.1 A-kinase anchor protein 10, mitochondrial [Rhopalosiphum maidis]XP_026804617.1 A-kinase anchor protein 10, mitochondrial [Rhopalosiphum maidis]